MPGKPVILWVIAAVLWAAAIGIDIAGINEHLWVYALGLALLATQAATIYTFLHWGSGVYYELTRTILNRPHDRRHEDTGPLAAVTDLPVPAQREQRGRL